MAMVRVLIGLHWRLLRLHHSPWRSCSRSGINPTGSYQSKRSSVGFDCGSKDLATPNLAHFGGTLSLNDILANATLLSRPSTRCPCMPRCRGGEAPALLLGTRSTWWCVSRSSIRPGGRWMCPKIEDPQPQAGFSYPCSWMQM